MFAVVVTWSLLADALPPLLLDACLCSLGGYFATTALSFCRQQLRRCILFL
jgi:hypothetical protein